MKQNSPVDGYFEGERLELSWRYAYRPEFIPLLLNYMGAKSGMRILDVGCGSGFLSRLLARELDDIAVTGIDFDTKLLTFAQELLAREELTATVALGQGDAYKLPFADQTFDLVTSHTFL